MGINSATWGSSIMSSQALKATVQQSVRMASQVAEQHGGEFVWRAGVGYQYQGGKGGSDQQKGKTEDPSSGRDGSPRVLAGNISTRVTALVRNPVFASSGVINFV